MISMMVILYIVTWISITYSLVTAPTDVELWNEEVE